MAFARAERPGVILFRGGRHSTAEARERLVRALETIPEEELPTSMVVIESWRIRRRRLPIQ